MYRIDACTALLHVWYTGNLKLIWTTRWSLDYHGLDINEIPRIPRNVGYRVSQFHTYIVEAAQKIFYTQNMLDYHQLEVKPADDQQLCCHHCNKYVWYDRAISVTFV